MDPESPKDPNGLPSPSAPAPAGAPDPKSFLLKPKASGPSLDSAERVSASALFEQEAKAAAKPLETPIGEVSVPAVPPPPTKEESVVKALETYGTDINRVVSQGDVSVVSIAAAEAERRTRAASGEPVAPQPLAKSESSPMRPVLYIAGGLLLLSALGIVAALLWRPSASPVQPTGDAAAPFLEVDQTVPVLVSSSATHESLMTDLEAARAKLNISLGLVARLYVAAATSTSKTPDPLPANELLALLAPDMPQDLQLTILPTYLLGIHSYDQNEAFLVLRVDSYQQAFSGMLAWEDFMQRDLSPLFNYQPPTHIQNQPAASSTIATLSAATSSQTTSQPESQVIRTGFVDQVVDNHDARVLRNPAGDIILLWTFLDRNTLVITTNQYTLSEVIRRVNTSSLVPLPQ